MQASEKLARGGLITNGVVSEGWDIEASDDPGLYLCEFIYYSSLIAARRLGEEGRSLKGVFVHVPPYLDTEALDKERDTVVQVIREMVKEDEAKEQRV